MNKSKFLIILIIGLIISNGVLLFILFKEQQGKGGPKNIIIDKLHLDNVQIKKYEVYIQQHRKAINEQELKINAMRSKLYEQLKSEQDSAKVDSLISIITQQQYEAEKINYNHFLEIKRLCKPSQLKYFEELTIEISNLFSLKKRK